MPASKPMTPEELAMQDLLERSPETASLPQGVPDVSGPQYGISNVTPEKGLMETMVYPAILPTAGTAIGGMVGGIPGAMAGGALGELGNQAMGVTDPSLTNIALSGGAAAIGGPTNLGAKMFGRRGAQVLNALAPEEAAMHLAKLEPGIASKFLFKEAAESGATIPMGRASQAITSMLDDLGSSSKGVQQANRTALSYLKGLQEKLTANPHGLSPADLQRELAGAGEVMKNARAKGGAGLGAIKKVYGAMADDLDAIANQADEVGSRAALTLKDARDTFKREAAVDEISGAVDKAFKVLRGQGDAGQFNASMVLSELKKNDFVKQAFSADEIKEMEKLFTKLNKIPALRPGAGQQAGSRSVLQGPVMGGSFGAAASSLLGAGPTLGGAVGAAAGVAIPPTLEMARNISTAMGMKTGRALLGSLLKNSDGAITPQVMSIIGAYAEAVRAGKEGAIAP